MSIADDPVAIPQSDEDRLITALQTCFVDLAKKQEEQGEKLYRAVEALKPQVPSTDKKTAFWNSYMKLADEYDKEFQEKYSTDLDTALIFSGLFSAVASAFVIQIEPQLAATNPPKIIVIVQCLLYASLFTTLLAALLAVLGKQWLMYYQAAGSRGTIEERGRERQRKLDGLVKWKFEAVLQAFPLLLQLALLLFASSISLYLWTVQHSVAILVTFLTALGLSSYIILLVSATIFSDCPFQTPLGPLLRQAVKTIGGTLQPVLGGLRTAISKPLGAIYRVNALRTISTKLRDTTRRFWPLVSRFGRLKLNLLPHFASQTSLSTNNPDPYAEYKSIEVSPEMPAVVWTLTTSTDPAMITVAADLGADLEWPLLDRTPETIMYRLLVTAHSYVEYSSRTVRPGMTHLAVVCAKLHCALRSQLPRNLGFYRFYNLFRLKIEASNASEYAAILQIDDDGGGNVRVELPDDSAVDLKWVLHIIPSSNIPLRDTIRYLARKFPMEAQADMQIFTNFLYCIGATSVWAEPWLKRRVDKSGLCYLLMNHFFVALCDLAIMDTEVTIKLLNTAAQMAVELASQFPRATFDERINLVREMSKFSNRFPRVEGWLDVAVTAAKLGRTSLAELKILHQRNGLTPYPPLPSFDIQSIYMALEHVEKSWQEGLWDAEEGMWDTNTICAVDGLLQTLSYNDCLPDNPPIWSLHIILRALSSTTDVAATAFLVLARAKSWFVNPELHPIMLQFSMWHHLGRVARHYEIKTGVLEDVVTDSYQQLVQHVAPRPEWKSALLNELPTCIAAFSDPSGWMRWHGSEELEAQRSDLISVLQNIWVPSFPQVDGRQQRIQFTNSGQHCTALCLVALSNVWESYDTAKSSLEQFLQLVRCTVSTVSTALFKRNWILSPLKDFEPVFTSRLCRALAQAAANARHSIEVGISGSLDAGPSPVEAPPTRRMAELLETLTQKLEIEFNKPDHQGWDALRGELEAEIGACEESLAQQNAQEAVPVRAEALVAQVEQQDAAEEVGQGAHIAVTVD
ncbi:hypothetical protein B0H16DRAFT_254765 [Mycena metata]|uniref:DUF6535 domain-containing protein n=1 Tax=Mycena metata TaxID=1033252 RepID=A0AAD7JPP8_9AGAR|nr:hypothetical protein B0H16DRAFT_254765 [Mycena metata]